ncbi:MAG: SRPBCC family protein [Ardenticatenaceae bacterium]|nr:SRPBCC family protein [Ardenticatenaceae bacterium]HBY97016.1 hypothetical protein [Chloroflexota bacterium]
MPVSAEASRLIRAAPGAVWQVWRDFQRWPRWQPEAVEAHWLAGAPWTDGSTFSLLRRVPWALLRRLMGGGARRFVGRVLSTAEEQLLVWELRPTMGTWLGPTLVESVRLEPAPGGTTVSLTLTAHGPLPTLLGPLGLRGQLRSQAEETLDGLQRLLQVVKGD